MSRSPNPAVPEPVFDPQEIQRRAMAFHPLQAVPGFRNVRRGPLLDLLWTFLWSTGLGLAFTGLTMMMTWRVPTLHALWVNLALSNGVGFMIHAGFWLGGATGIEARVYRGGRTAVTAYTTAIATLGVVAGFFVAGHWLGLDFDRWLRSPRWIIAVATSSLFISVILVAIFFWRAKTAAAEAALEHEKLRVARIEREALVANLRALQAQIEPHFLFNTLANVTSLIDPDPAKAKGMLESFIRFLRASLAATRGESTTLGAEAELIRAYLEVLQVRMGARLASAVDVDPALAGFPLPPMLLQPVVENAIRHGLEPKVEGGLVSFRARREGGSAVIEIADTGVGFAAATAGGVGLTNLRDRLKLLYGERARLEIRDNAPAGTVVTLRIPA